MIIIRGKVRYGKNRGKELGFPTANINLRRKIPEGVYVSFAKIKGRLYKSLAFIGSPKTFGEEIYRAETYLLDFQNDLYGQWITIRLIKKIRGNKKFNSIDNLVDQMKQDLKKAKKIFSQF